MLLQLKVSSSQQFTNHYHSPVLTSPHHTHSERAAMTDRIVRTLAGRGGGGARGSWAGEEQIKPISPRACSVSPAARGPRWRRRSPAAARLAIRAPSEGGGRGGGGGSELERRGQRARRLCPSLSRRRKQGSERCGREREKRRTAL